MMLNPLPILYAAAGSAVTALGLKLFGKPELPMLSFPTGKALEPRTVTRTELTETGETVPMREVLRAEDGVSPIPSPEEAPASRLKGSKSVPPTMTPTIFGAGTSLGGRKTLKVTDPEETLDRAYASTLPRLLEIEEDWEGIAALHDLLDSYSVPLVLDPHPTGLRTSLQVVGGPYFETEGDADVLAEGEAIRVNPIMLTRKLSSRPVGASTRKVHVNEAGEWFVWDGLEYVKLPINTNWDVKDSLYFDYDTDFADLGLSYGNSDRILVATGILTGEENPVGPGDVAASIAEALFPPLPE